MGGRAVHARGSRREKYAAVRRVAIKGDAVAVAATCVNRFGIEAL